VPKGLSRTAIAEVLGVPRSRFYPRGTHSRKRTGATQKVKKKPKVFSDEQIATEIRKLLSKEPRYASFGYRRWKAVLKKRGIIVNHKRLRRILRELGLTQPRTQRTRRKPAERVSWEPTGPNQVW